MCTFSIIPEACNLGEQMICRGGGEANCKNEIQPIESKFSQPVGRITQVALVKEKAFAKSEGISRATLRNNKSACYDKDPKQNGAVLEQVYCDLNTKHFRHAPH